MADVKTKPADGYGSALGKVSGGSLHNERGQRLRSQQDFGDYWNDRKHLDSGESVNLRGDVLEPVTDVNPWGTETLVVCGLVFFGLHLRKELLPRRPERT